MYLINVPLAQWYEVQQYLAHNYWCHKQHYTFERKDNSFELVCLKPDLYELVCKRFNLG
jgi:hypothetical protein